MSERRVTLMACGDINIQHRDDPARVFDLVKDHLLSADVRLGNLEMCLSSADDTIPDKRPIPGKPSWTQSDARMVEALVAAKFDLVTTANNVTYGHDAVLKSLQTLDAHQIAHTGSGANLAEARRPAIHVTDDGTRIGVLGYTCLFLPVGQAASDDEPGVAVVKCHTAYEPHRRAHELPGAPPTVRSWPDPEYLDPAKADVAKLRNDVDVLITYFHMGVSSQDELVEYQEHLSHAMVDAGADLVLGASAHKPQAIEIYKDKAIFYGLGNFAFDWWHVIEMRHGLLVECDIEDGALSRLSFRPVSRTRTDQNQVQILSPTDDEGRQIIDRVRELSQKFATRIEPDQNGEPITVWTANH